MRISACGFPTADFRLRISACGFPAADFRLRISGCGFPRGDFPLRISAGFSPADFGLRIYSCGCPRLLISWVFRPQQTCGFPLYSLGNTACARRGDGGGRRRGVSVRADRFGIRETHTSDAVPVCARDPPPTTWASTTGRTCACLARNHIGETRASPLRDPHPPRRPIGPAGAEPGPAAARTHPPGRIRARPAGCEARRRRRASQCRAAPRPAWGTKKME